VQEQLTSCPYPHYYAAESVYIHLYITSAPPIYRLPAAELTLSSKFFKKIAIQLLTI